LARSARDVLEGLAGRTGVDLPLFHGMSETVHRPAVAPEAPADGTRARIIEALGPAPMQLDELIRFVEADARTVNVVLLELELAGRLERHPGQKISLVMG
ncbi:MAG: DNA-protecting protein DprA, partial [Pseudomonadota bacterium]